MALQLSAAVRNARLDAIEATIGTSAVLKIRTGSAPAHPPPPPPRARPPPDAPTPRAQPLRPPNLGEPAE